MIAELHQKLINKEISAVELTKQYLRKIHDTNKTYNSFVLLTEDLALKQAAAADAIIKRGEATLLTGIPFAIKDNFCLQDTITSAGSTMLKNYTSPYTATAAQKLLDQSAVLLGKTNMDDAAMGSSTETSAYGPTKNAHDPTRVPGGSSGGSATAVALQQAVFALATDTGGSIRQPASLSGVVGLKPTYGRISRYGIVALASSLDVVGTLTHNSADAAIVLEALSGQDPHDSTTLPPEPAAAPGRPAKPKTRKHSTAATAAQDLTIGIPVEYKNAKGMAPDVQAALDQAIATLKKAGIKMKDITLPHAHLGIATYYVIVPSEASSNLARYDGMRFGHHAKEARNLEEVYTLSRAQGFGREVKRRIALGTFTLSAGYQDAYYHQAQKVRTLIREDFRRAFAEVDIILTPATPDRAFPLGAKTADPLSMYLQDIFTVTANLAGIPGLVVPLAEADALSATATATPRAAGGQQKLPIGMQFLGDMMQEEKLLSLGNFYESLTARA